ncbi:predicted protein [Nematostella vectensis]|uniref:Uncharacterized protein n=1 Tax=Nematostella vectensis TaxID=45351 RepID=A7SI00_NEMVE|nr:predicted protein [Nematostella vectensis]|eukprot:XP_001628725.1 predicted protein [Nematostella vectensis]
MENSSLNKFSLLILILSSISFYLASASESKEGRIVRCEDVKMNAFRMLCSGPCKTFYCPFIGERNNGDSISQYCVCTENEDFPGLEHFSEKNEFSMDGWVEKQPSCPKKQEGEDDGSERCEDQSPKSLMGTLTSQASVSVADSTTPESSDLETTMIPSSEAVTKTSSFERRRRRRQ